MTEHDLDEAAVERVIALLDRLGHHELAIAVAAATDPEREERVEAARAAVGILRGRPANDD